MWKVGYGVGGWGLTSIMIDNKVTTLYLLHLQPRHIPNRALSDSILNRAPFDSIPNRAPSDSIPNRAPSYSIPNRAPSDSIPNRAPSDSILTSTAQPKACGSLHAGLTSRPWVS